MVNKDRVYMDSCCFIDMAKIDLSVTDIYDQSRIDDVWYMRRLCDAAYDGEIEIITSTLTIAECLHDGNGHIGDKAKDLFEKFLTSNRVAQTIAAEYSVCVEARDLFWKHGILLSGADAIHLASAIVMNCKEFITTDNHFKTSKFKRAIKPIQKTKGLKISKAKDTTMLPTKYMQTTTDL
jgi:predicted nucleic acid-binding protein